MKTYRRHNCAARHMSFRTLAKCMFRRAAWVHGEGQYASLAWCGTLTVQLFDDLEQAETAKCTIDRSACGGKCRGASGHEIVRLVLPV